MTAERRQQQERRKTRGGGRRATDDIEDLATHAARHVSLSALARYFGVQRATILKWIDADALPAYRYHGILRVKTVDAHKFEASSRITTAHRQ